MVNTTTPEPAEPRRRPDRTSSEGSSRRRTLLAACGSLVVAVALAGPLFLPRYHDHGIGPWLPVGRVLQQVRSHGLPSDGVRPQPRGADRRQAAGSQVQPAHRHVPIVRRAPRSGFRGLRRVQCKLLHRHC